MKLKNISYVERNIEKFILALGVIFLLAVGWFYFIGNPYAVPMGIGTAADKVAPSEVEPLVRAAADKLKKEVSREESPLPPTPVPDYTNEFRERFYQDLLRGVEQYLPMAGPGLNIGIDDVPQTVFAVAMPPAPENVKARASFAVLGPQEDEAFEQQVRLIVGTERPTDFRYVSISAEFDMDAWQKKLRSGDEETRIPEDWWRPTMLFTDVVLERQTLDQATGQWGPVERVKPMPGRPVFDAGVVHPTEDEARALFAAIRESQEYLLRPPFVITAGDHTWLPPEAPVKRLSAEEQTRLRKLNEEIRRIDQQLRRLQGRPVSDAAAPGPGAEPGNLPGIDGDRPRPATPARRTTTAGPDRSSDIQRLTEELNVKLAAKAELLGVTADDVATMPGMRGPDGPYGPDPGLGPNAFPPSPDGRQPIIRRPQPAPGTTFGPPAGRDDPAVALGPDGQPLPPEPVAVKIWAHDLTAKPGNVYRYRLRAMLMNPLYRRGAMLTPAQREQFSNKLALPSETSAWSDPVETEPSHHFFLVEGGGQGQGTVEVWTIFNGAWRTQKFSVKAGYPIGQVIDRMRIGQDEASVDMRVGAIVVDLDSNVPSGGLGGTTTKMIYMNSAGQIAERSLEADRDDPKRIELLNAAESSVAAASAAP